MHVEVAVEPGEHRPDGGAVAGRHELDRVRRQAGAAQDPRAWRRRSPAAERKLSEPARRIAALPALRQSAPASAVDVGAALEDHADDAERRRDALDREPVRALEAASTRPTGSGSSAMLSTAAAIASTRASSRARRSRKAGVCPPPSPRRHRPHWRRGSPARRRGSRPPWREAPRSSRSAPASESRRAAARARAGQARPSGRRHPAPTRPPAR